MHSMKGRTRRGFLDSMAKVSAVGVLGLWSGPIASASRIAIPETPMILSRRLVRGLHDGKTITVERSWNVHFRMLGNGIVVTGEQLSARVDAPAKLAPIVRIEEARSTAQLWPLRLSSEGKIVSSGVYTSREDIEAAIRAGREIIRSSGASDGYKALKLGYLSRLEQAGGSLLEKLPSDLFFPAGGESALVDVVELPGGVTGTLEVIYRSASAGEGAWLARAERQITTRIGEDERLSSDAWRLDPP